MDEALTFEVRRGDHMVSCDPARLDIDYLYGFLSEAYWHDGLRRDRLQRSIAHSINFGLFRRVDGRQIGYARVVGDRATFAYVADVFVDAELRGAGLGRWLMESVHAHPELRGLKRWVLQTRDAHRFYEALGYVKVGEKSGFMVRTP